MLTVAEGGALGAVVIDAHPAIRRIVILAKAELINLVFMDLRLTLTNEPISVRSFRQMIGIGSFH
jgi:hypothetical protein